MTSKTKIMDVLLRVENDSYLQEYVKPYSSNYIIMTDDGRNYVLGKDTHIGEYFSDNRDGLKEGFVLIHLLSVNDDFRDVTGNCQFIIYPDKETAFWVLDDAFRAKLNDYFGTDKWVVKRLQTIFYLEDCDDK